MSGIYIESQAVPYGKFKYCSTRNLTSVYSRILIDILYLLKTMAYQLQQPGTRKNHKVDAAQALKMRLVKKMSYQEIGDKFGCDKSVVFRAIKRFENIIKEPEEIEAYRQCRAELIDSAEMQVLEKMCNPETVAKASLNNAAYAFAQLHNAGRLERGKSTQNVDMRQLTMSLSELQEEQKRLEKELGITETQQVVQAGQVHTTD